jgi:hypothetical protein
MACETAGFTGHSLSHDQPCQMYRSLAITAFLLALATLSGCRGERPDFTSDYRTALAERPGHIAEEAWVARFVDAYGAFKGEDLGERLKQVYAEEPYFNDTLRTVRARSELISYLEHTAQRLDSMALTMMSTHIEGADVYLRWQMHTEFSVGWRDASVDTIGMTHLRFNDAGEVVLHQDFWDSRQGIFEHIPFLGGMIGWVRGKL